MVIAPEGTRLDTTEVGPFKKGPFRIAMAAGIPIVPVVIRNAEVIGARDSSTFNPGTVDVAVFPPIPVDDWTVDNLAAHIAGVRQLYLDTLKKWPVDELPDAPCMRAQDGASPQEGTRQEGRGQEAAGQEGAGQEGGHEDGSQERPRRRLPPGESARATRTTRDGSEGAPPTEFDGYDITGDALVLASVSSPAELDLLNDWLSRQRGSIPKPTSRCCNYPVRTTRRRHTGATRRGARSRRGPIRRPGTGVLGAGRAADAGRRWSACCRAAKPTVRRN